MTSTCTASSDASEGLAGQLRKRCAAPQRECLAELRVGALVVRLLERALCVARLRRAVNYALDRRALARDGLSNGLPAQPTDQYLPPTMPGFRDARIYPLRPDVARARRLAGPRRRSVVLYISDSASQLRFAEILRLNLRAIGMEVEIRDL